MASLGRLYSSNILRRIFSPTGKLNSVTVRRWISKSETKQDVTIAKPPPSTAKLPPVPKNWVSWGFSYTNYYEDRILTHLFSFVAISWVMVGTCWILYYYPDMMKHEWYHREAFLELKRREAAGLPLVDPDYVPRSQISLPSDEELGDFEIII